MAGVRPVLVQMWLSYALATGPAWHLAWRYIPAPPLRTLCTNKIGVQCAMRWCRCGRGEPSPDADVAGTRSLPAYRRCALVTARVVCCTRRVLYALHRVLYALHRVLYALHRVLCALRGPACLSPRSRSRSASSSTSHRSRCTERHCSAHAITHAHALTCSRAGRAGGRACVRACVRAPRQRACHIQ